MAFTQIITIDGADEQALHDHVAAWDAEQGDAAPGYQGVRVLADQQHPGRHLVQVDFDSEDSAQRNNDRAETQAWAEQLRELAGGEPSYRDLREVCTTYAKS